MGLKILTATKWKSSCDW